MAYRRYNRRFNRNRFRRSFGSGRYRRRRLRRPRVPSRGGYMLA